MTLLERLVSEALPRTYFFLGVFFTVDVADGKFLFTWRLIMVPLS